jgi:hypothetical protein
MIFARPLIVIFCCLFLAEAHAADWQYAGLIGKDKASFFDAESIQYPDKGTVRMWVKNIPEKSIKKYLNGKNRESVIEDSARKIASGYMPNYFKLESVKRLSPEETKTQDALATMVSDEIIANQAGVQATTATFFEIDCQGRRIAPLTIIKYRKNGSVVKTETPQPVKYFYIVPDSSGDWLSMLVCPKS